VANSAFSLKTTNSSVLRGLYSLLLYLLTPFVLLRLAWRGLRAHDYWRRWPERFGFFPALPTGEVVWIHAVSVGEAQATVPLVQALRKRHPGRPILVTTTTPTGSARVRETLGAEVSHVYVPYDLPGAVRRFLANARPSLAIIMEAELWPNLFHGCRQRGVPVMLANARLPQRSADRYRPVAALVRQALADVSAIAAQSRPDAERLIALGADPVHTHVTGSIKFDIKLPVGLREQAAALRREFGNDRPVWIAASTHEGEEDCVLDAFERVKRVMPDCLLVLVPRHPERFVPVAGLCRRRGHHIALRSELQICAAETDVFVGDTMGELPLFYAASDVAFVGGSLVPAGCHNLMEPAALGIPMITGPYLFNYEEASRMLMEVGARQTVRDAAQLASAVEALLRDATLRDTAGGNGRKVVEENRGALKRLLEIVNQYVD